MRVAYYPSFRALDHVRSSGLVSIARDVRAAMQAEGHEVILPMNLSMEWIYLRPKAWPDVLREALRADRIHVTGPRDLARALPTWNKRSVWAA